MLIYVEEIVANRLRGFSSLSFDTISCRQYQIHFSKIIPSIALFSVFTHTIFFVISGTITLLSALN